MKKGRQEKKKEKIGKEGRGDEWRKRKKQEKKRRSLVTQKEKDKEGGRALWKLQAERA